MRKQERHHIPRNGGRRRRWAKKALVCITVLPLFISSVNVLRVPSAMASFIGPSCCMHDHRKCSPTIQYAARVEEQTWQQEEESFQPTISHQEEARKGFADMIDAANTTVSVKIINVDGLHDSFPHRNGRSYNGHPVLHQPPPEVNGVQQPVVNGKTQPTTVRKLWQRRHARSVEEGVRREKTGEKATQLYMLLSKVAPSRPGYFARTISGLISALAEEADGLEVDVDAREETPLWRKQVDAIRINFSRLGFKPLRMGGLDEAIRSFETQIPESRVENLAKDLELAAVSSADEAFDRIDEDKSGALDPYEIAKALSLAASSDSDDEKLLEELATQLVELYDFNGDGVVDRAEYQSLVADMAKLRQVEKDRQERRKEEEEKPGLFHKVAKWIWRKEDEAALEEEMRIHVEAKSQLGVTDISENNFDSSDDLVNIDHDAAVDSVTRGSGSIVLQDLKLDLRQLIFGFVPFLKRITPGGPLILEPFMATVTGSFNKDDIKASFLLDAGLRRLVARALRRRVRSFRDLVDGAVFYGRTWNMASESAPMVEVPELTSVEFDEENRIIMTGRAQVQSSPNAPFIENTFKVRTKIGTRKNGQVIRLVEPELAFVLECPESWEHKYVVEATIFRETFSSQLTVSRTFLFDSVQLAFKTFGLLVPKRPKPLYSFFPIYSPFKVDDNDGFDLGEDNRIKSIDIKDGALQFEVSMLFCVIENICL